MRRYSFIVICFLLIMFVMLYAEKNNTNNILTIKNLILKKLKNLNLFSLIIYLINHIFVILLEDSSMVEHSAVNRRVAGSSPALPASDPEFFSGFLV